MLPREGIPCDVMNVLYIGSRDSMHNNILVGLVVRLAADFSLSDATNRLDIVCVNALRVS